SFMRMNAYRGMQLRKTLGQAKGTIERARTIANADGQYCVHSSGAGALQNLFSVRVESFSFQMSVRVNVHALNGRFEPQRTLGHKRNHETLTKVLCVLCGGRFLVSISTAPPRAHPRGTHRVRACHPPAKPRQSFRLTPALGACGGRG